MQPLPLEIYQVQLPYRLCNDFRPAIVIEPPHGGKVVVALISAEMDLYRGPAIHFLVDATHPDFPKTGLKKTCYIAGDEIVNANLERLGRKRGILSGELALKFNKWIWRPPLSLPRRPFHLPQKLKIAQPRAG